MTDHNRYASYRAHEFSGKRRWRAAVSAIAMIIASAMVMTVGTSAYADDAKFVKDMEDAQAQLAKQTETESDESLDSGFSVDAESNTAESSGDGLDFGALADWSRVEEANILDRIVAFVNEDGTHAVTSSMQNGAFAVADLNDLSEDSDDWQWRIVAVDEKKAKDDATSFSVYLQCVSNDEYVTVDEDGSVSFTEKKDDATALMLAFTDADAFDKALEQDSNTPLRENTFMLSVAADDSSDKKTDGRDFVLSDDDSDADSAADRVLTAKGDDNPAKTDASSLVVYALKDESDEVDAADEADADADADNGVEAQAELEATGFTIKKDTVSPKNTLINVFDYWDTTSTTPDSGPAGNSSNSYQGINNGHALRFLRTSTNTGWGSFNQYTGNKQVAQGIVANTLENGYPKLSGSNNLVGSAPNWWGGGGDTNYNANKNESLAYLFDPDVQSTGKASYKNAKGLLSVNEEGYFEYNAATNAARLDTRANADGSHDFTVYNKPAICQGENGQFFPFNDPNDVKGAGSCSANFNHFFGMTLVTSFTQQYGGHVAHEGAATTFEFSGDDDVWIFIDDVLVADAGGIHGAASISIDFSTGRVAVNEKFNGTNGAATIESWLYDAFHNAGRTGTTSWNGRTFADGTEHTLKFYYMERGHSYSNLWVKYNMISQIEMNVTKVDQYGDPIAGAKFAVFPGRIKEGSDPKDLGVGTAEYLLQGKPINSTNDADYRTLSKNASVSHDGMTITDVDEETQTTYKFEAISGQNYTTGEDGKITFLKGGSFYQAEDMKKDFGEEFILREISVPSGYRTVADESVLGFEGDVLVSKNKYVTGTVATPKFQVDATQTLYPSVDSNADEILYYTIGNDGQPQVNGTLFAVVQHRHGDNPWSDLKNLQSWVALYGSDEKGYFSAADLVGKDAASTLAGSIAAAKEQNKNNGKDYESTVFTPSTGLMQLNFEELPGESDQYYSFIEQEYFDGNSKEIEYLVTTACPAEELDDGSYNVENRFTKCAGSDGSLTHEGHTYTAAQLAAMDKLRYLVMYYWTSAPSIDGATESNTQRVHSHAGTPNAVNTYSGFDVQWGSNVRIPNVENRLYFQNFIYHEVPGDTDGQDANTAWVDGAKFALYRVGETVSESTGDNEKLYYIPDDMSLLDGTNAVGIYLNPDPKRDGTLTDVAWLINAEGNAVSDNGVYTISSSDTDKGKITVEINHNTYIISPAKDSSGNFYFSGVAEGDSIIAERGSNYFSRIPQGEYVLRMISPSTNVPVSIDKDGKMKYDPENKNAEKVTYGMNIAEVPVKVTQNAIYANAGDNHDGITVGNGAGYLVDTMNQFASQGMLDESLTWIAMFLRVNYAKNFAEFDNFIDAAGNQWDDGAWFGTKSNMKFNDTNQLIDSPSNNTNYAISRAYTLDLIDAMTTYLQYDPTAKGSEIEGSENEFYVLFDYAAGDQTLRGSYDDDGSAVLGTGEGKLRLYTDEGWSMANIYQDYTYGNKMSDHNTEFIDLRNHEITQLFSESTFVAFYAPPSEMPQIIKVEADTLNTGDNNLWIPSNNDQCDGINNAKQDAVGNTYCRVNYTTTVSKARFVISRERTNGTKEFRTADGWTTDETEAQKFTSDDQGLLTGVSAWGAHEGPYNVGTAGFQYKTYNNLPNADLSGNKSVYNNAILYTIEETDPPVGYAKLTKPITFWMYNKTVPSQSSRDASTTYIAVADGTNGVSVSNDGMKLRIENRSSLSIVKVEEGSDAYIYVQMPMGINIPSLEDVLNILNKSDGDKTEEEEQYVRVTSSDAVDTPSNMQVVQYLDTYTKRLEGASFYLKNESTNKFYKEGNINGVNDIDDATKLVSSANGVILNPSDTSNQSETVTLAAGNYSLIEVDIPDGYTKVKSGDITFTVEGGSGTGLKFAQMSNNTTPESVKTGVQTSDNGRILYVENRPIPSIVKVEQGTDSDVVIQLNEGYSASDTDICAKIAAAKDGDTYLPYGSPVEGATEANPVQNQVQCFVGYNKTLKGAQFTLSRVAADNQTEYYVVDTDGNVSWSSGNSSVATVIDSKDMGFVLSITGGAGTYTLTEVAAPDGYTFVSKDPIVFGIGSNGHIVNPNAAGAGDNLTKTGVRVSANGLTLYVENKAGVQLPSTGGLNWYWLMLVAALAIAIGLGVRERMRRQMNNLAHTTGQSE